MITRRRVLGASVVKFLPSEDRAARPADDAAGYIDLGVSDWAVESTAVFETLMAPAPGRRVPYDEIQTAGGVNLTGTLKELSNAVYQLMLGAAPTTGPAAGGVFVPMAAEQRARGWLQIDGFDQYNGAVVEIRAFVSLRVTGPLPGADAAVDTTVAALVLHTTQNQIDVK